MPTQEQIKLVLMMAARDHFGDTALSDRDEDDYRVVVERIRDFSQAPWAEAKYGPEKVREAKAWIALHDSLLPRPPPYGQA